MRNRPLIKFQLVLLVIVAGLVIWRGQKGPVIPDGKIVFADMSEGKLYRSGLLVESATPIVVSTTAAFETDKDNAEIATYGWILDRDSREVVWMTDPSKLDRDGVLAVGVDSIHLSPGTYDVFYTTFGPSSRSRRDAPFLGLTPYWTNYRANWHMSIAEAGDGADPRALIVSDANAAEKRTFEGSLWTTGPVGSRAYDTFLFRMENTSSVEIYAIGEMCPTGCDYGWIENATTDEKVWQMDWDNTTPAGGAESNRVFRGAVTLEPGIYRATYRTNGDHSAGSWQANPPLDPDGWGMALYGVDDNSASEFDPWEQAEPIIKMTEVGDDEHRMTEFRLNRQAGLLIYAVGEATTRGSLYDYAWLEENESGDTIWKMNSENSLPAGGDSINRLEMAFVDLQPGAYTIHFMSDGGHSFEGWIRTKPSHPERWGVTVFPVNPQHLTADDFEILRNPSPSSGKAASQPSLPRTDLGTPIVSMVQVGNDADLFHSFRLETVSELYIIAQGEISSGGSWDYGWIESDDTSERVWEMTLGNTRDAGGEDRNRRFEGKITLPAGSYTARYVSDFSHSYGDFGDELPNHPGDWGMSIYLLQP